MRGEKESGRFIGRIFKSIHMRKDRRKAASSTMEDDKRKLLMKKLQENFMKGRSCYRTRGKKNSGRWMP
jgi:hypothetical protein